jgi:hypothetical protein
LGTALATFWQALLFSINTDQAFSPSGSFLVMAFAETMCS